MSTTSFQSSCIEQRMESTPSPFELLAATAQQRPDHAALEFLPSELDGAPLRLSYQQLLQDVQAVAAALTALGVERDESVAILLPFVPQAVATLIGASAVAVAFPVNLLLSAEAIASQLTIARCRVVVTMGAHPALDVHERVMLALKSMDVAPTVVEVAMAGPASGALSWERFIGAASSFEAVDASDRVAAYVHTGGTTGSPKLARLSLRNMASAALMASAGLGIKPSDRLLTGLPLFHVGGAIDALMAALAVGATVVFPSPLGMRDAVVVQQIWQLIARHEITILGAVPTSLASMLDSTLGSVDLSQFRGVMTGGSSLPEEVSHLLQSRVGKPIYQLYGMTESSGIATAQLTSGARVAHAVGTPVPGIEISLGDPGSEYRPGMKGEILIRGPNIFRGYLTAQGVIDDPQGAWFATGDLGEVAANGELRIVGRSKDVIIRSGHNIDPQVIEEIAYQHRSVAQAAAVAMPDDYAGEIPVLFVAARAGTAINPCELSAFVADRIAEPPARPKHIFVLDELPLTPFGKVARFRLRQLAVEYKVTSALADLVGPVVVTCNDPAAKCLAIRADAPLTASQKEQVERMLRRLDLQVVD